MMIHLPFAAPPMGLSQLFSNRFSAARRFPPGLSLTATAANCYTGVCGVEIMCCERRRCGEGIRLASGMWWS
jgi:hypothetical protein